MDVKDYTQKLDSARDRYRQAQIDLKDSYDKSVDDLKENHEHKINHQRENYDKSKLETESVVSENLDKYSEQTKNEIAKRQEDFKKSIKENTEKFSTDREKLKSDFDTRLTDLSESFRKSSNEKDRYHSEAQKTLKSRYDMANNKFSESYNKDLTDLTARSKKTLDSQKELNKEKRTELSSNFQKEVDEMRETSREEKFKEVSRLRQDNKNLRENFEVEKKLSDEQRDARIGDILDLKKKESLEGQKNFSNLQENIRKKNISDQEKLKVTHLDESKKAEKQMSEDVKNIQRMANQKIAGGTEVDGLKEKNRQLQSSYEARISALNENQKDENLNARIKEEQLDTASSEKIKALKLAKTDALEKQKTMLNNESDRKVHELRDKNVAIVDRYKNENSEYRKFSDKKFNDQRLVSTKEAAKNREEFGKVVNALNEKNIETVSTLKDEFAKDKSQFIERSKRDFNDEKVAMKEQFNKTVELREQAFNKKLEAANVDTHKIIENYEERLEQIARKSDKEMEAMRIANIEMQNKNEAALKNTIESMEADNTHEIDQLRTKYEQVIARDRAMNEQQVNKIVQRYEDQLDRERFSFNREAQARATENQTQFERMFRNAEIEKDTLRKQYEDRIEMMKIHDLKKG